MDDHLNVVALAAGKEHVIEEARLVVVDGLDVAADAPVGVGDDRYFQSVSFRWEFTNLQINSAFAIASSSERSCQNSW
jgi:hypothetical protein